MTDTTTSPVPTQAEPATADLAGQTVEPAGQAADLALQAGVPAGQASEIAGQAADLAGQAAELAGAAKERIGEFADKAGDALADAAGRAGEALSEAAQTAIARIRNNATVPSERGQTQIAGEVVEKVAGIAAREVPGVFDLGGDTARVVTAVREFLHLGDESKAQGVGVRLEGKQAQISVTLVIEYGFVVSSVTDKVREKIISSVEELLELDVVAVDILVDDVHVDSSGKAATDAARAAAYDSSTKGVVVGKA